MAKCGNKAMLARLRGISPILVCIIITDREPTAGDALIITFTFAIGDEAMHGWGTFPNCSPGGLGYHLLAEHNM
jgi:hypothetical protein